VRKVEISKSEKGRKRKILQIVISAIIGFTIVWFLLSKIELKDIPMAIGNIPKQDLLIAFFLYVISVFFKAARFKTILRSDIGLGRIFSIVSLYMFFANFLPMRAGELSYMYLLKREANTPGTKSFASLIVGVIADMMILLVMMIIVAWHLRSKLAERSMHILVSDFAGSLIHKFTGLRLIIMIFAVLLVLVAGFLLIRHGFKKHFLTIKDKFFEVLRELAFIKPDIRLLAIIIFSILIMTFRFGTQWYVVRSMEVNIDIWQFAFALLFGVLFSIIPIHGPAGLGTVEAPWVLTLVYLNVSEKDAITSGFSLHIIIMVFCVIIGLYGLIGLRKIGYVQNGTSNSK
jgi:glycosyltransferase 2 family protein